MNIGLLAKGKGHESLIKNCDQNVESGIGRGEERSIIPETKTIG